MIPYFLFAALPISFQYMIPVTNDNAPENILQFVSPTLSQILEAQVVEGRFLDLCLFAWYLPHRSDAKAQHCRARFRLLLNDNLLQITTTPPRPIRL